MKTNFLKRNSCDGRYASSLDVRFTKACDNNCPFCIEKCGIKSLGKTNVEELIHSTIISKKKDILILGGEPLLLIPEVLQYVKGIRKSVNHIYITTSLPATINENSRDFAEIVNLIDGLNVSLQHFNSEENNKILHATNKHDRIELLHSLCVTKDWTDKIRVSINLIKGAIDNKEKLLSFLSVMNRINVKHVKINELQDSSDLYVSFCDIYGKKMKSPYAHGCQQDITLKEFPFMRITLKRSCFVVNEDLDATLADLFKLLIKNVISPFKRKKKVKEKTGVYSVLYENGKLEKGWKKDEAFNNKNCETISSK